MTIPSHYAERQQQLVGLEDARKLLAEAQSIHDVKEIRTRAESIRAHAQRATLGIEQQNYAAELKLQAERRGGQILWNMKLRGGDRKSTLNGTGVRLRDLGIDKNQSARWQLEASVPENVFCEFVRQQHAHRREISSAGLLRIAKQLRERSFDDLVDAKQESLFVVSTESHLLHSARAAPDQGSVRVDELSDLVSEARNHHELLTSLVKTVCLRACLHPASTDYRAIQRYLGEVERHLIDIATGLNHLAQRPSSRRATRGMTV